MRTHSEWNVEISGLGCLLAAALAEQGQRAFSHLARGLVREGDRQDAVGPHPVLDQLRDAKGDDASLAGARAGQDQERAGERLDRFVLGAVEAGVCHR